MIHRGLSVTHATAVVNIYRNEKGLPSVSWSAVENWTLHTPSLQKLRRVSKKSGTTDGDSAWARARVAQCQQWELQLKIANDSSTPNENNLLPLYLDGIVWWDEKHQKVKLGCNSKHEVLVCRDRTSGKLSTQSEGGVFSERLPVTTVKFPQEARFAFGCAVRTKEGIKEGVKAEPFEYTGLKVLGPAQFEKLVERELARVQRLPSRPYNYKLKFPDTWRNVVTKKLRQPASGGAVCVTEMMHHIVLESAAIYKGTAREQDFHIFHDGLSQVCKGIQVTIIQLN